MSWIRSGASALSDLTTLDELDELTRPVVVATDRLRTVIERLKTEQTEAVADLRREVLTLGRGCPEAKRLELARVLYWLHSEVPVGDIAIAFGFHSQRELAAAVGPVRSGAMCDECDRVLIATSRRELAQHQRAAQRGAACPACQTRRARAFFDEVFWEPPEELYDDDPEAWGSEVIT